MPPQVSPELRKIQSDINQVLALKGVLQTVDRALSGVSDLTVNVVKSSTRASAPAWTDGKRISMDEARVLQVFAEQSLGDAILTFKGTNFHELAHVLFTPRHDDAIGVWIKDNHYKYKWAWNALEDQRIETLYTALYPPTVPYFRNSSYRWLLNETVGTDYFYRVYSLVGGRKYLDRSVRRAARQAFVDHYGVQVADAVDRVVNEYIALPLPGSQDRAIELVEEFYRLLRGTDLENYLKEQGGKCGGEGAGKNGAVDPEKAIEAAVRVRENQDEEAKQDEADGPQEQRQAPSSGGYPEDDQDTPEGEEQESQAPSTGGYPEDDQDRDNDESDDNQGSAQGSKGDQNEDIADKGDQAQGQDDSAKNPGNGNNGSESEDANDGSPGTGASTGTQDKPPVDPAKELQDALSEALADTLTDEKLQQDIDRSVEAFKANAAGKGEPEQQPSYDDYVEVDAQDDTIATVQKIVAQLRMLKTDAEATWIRERINGTRVNVNHVIRNQADPTHLEVFEEWDEGYEEEAKTEVVIALDLSGSMANVLPQCSQALWALKKSFDKVEVPTTVLGFSNSNVVLYGKDEKLQGLKVRQFGDWAGTVPRDTLLYAHRLLAKSGATNKVLIVITDGVWSGYKEDGADPENVVADIRKRGGSTLLFGVNGHRTASQDHGFEQTADLTDIGDIVRIVKDLVVNIQKRARNSK
jgi:hypothetical protein